MLGDSRTRDVGDFLKAATEQSLARARTILVITRSPFCMGVVKKRSFFQRLVSLAETFKVDCQSCGGKGVVGPMEHRLTMTEVFAVEYFLEDGGGAIGWRLLSDLNRRISSNVCHKAISALPGVTLSHVVAISRTTFLVTTCLYVSPPFSLLILRLLWQK